jgi:CO/xanthine dehydrogenase Mo-binding subunit
LRAEILDLAAELAADAPSAWLLTPDAAVRGNRRIALSELAAAANVRGKALTGTGHNDGTPRSVAFNVQAFRLAVNKRTGAIKILRSVHAADAGQVLNPMQCRGQVEGGVAQSLGAALYEEMILDDSGKVTNPNFRNYHLPQFGDVPRTEVLFADTHDVIGPFGAKSMSESPYNPINAAISNALADATGIRFCQTPFKPDRIFRAIADKFGTAE